MTIGIRRTASFVLAFGCAGIGVLACVLNPQPLPPDNPDAAFGAAPSAVQDAAARDARPGDAKASTPPDAGNPTAEPDASFEDGPDAERDATSDAEPDGYVPDGAADAHDDP